MSKGTNNIFHFHDEDRVIDIDAASYSEARRKFNQTFGYFPPEDSRNGVEPNVIDENSISRTTPMLAVD
jgi:hypothetical protein